MAVGLDGAWSVVIVAGQTKPVLGSSANPQMDLAIQATSLTWSPARNPTITFSDNGFGPMSTNIPTALSGYVVGTGQNVSYNTYYDAGNVTGAETTLRTASGNLAPPTYSSIHTGGPISQALYSLTQVVTIGGAGTGAGGSYTLDATIGTAGGVDLAVSAAASPNPVVAGSNTTLTVTVQNIGTATASSVRLTNVIPASLIFLSAASSQGSCTFTSAPINVSAFGPLFQLPTDAGAGTNTRPASVIAADLDGDGFLDLVSANSQAPAGSSGFVSVFRNLGTFGALDANSFAPRIEIPAIAALDIVAADFDGDGRTDLALCTLATNGPIVVLLRNISTGSGDIRFEPWVGLVGTGGGYALSVGDLNRDGKPDLVLANENRSSLYVFENRTAGPGLGTNSFGPPLELPVGLRPRCLAVGDLDADGWPDIAVGHDGTNVVALISNLRTASLTTNSFTPADLESTLTPISSVAITDLNGDGTNDVLITFDSVSALALADLNGDGKPDVAVLNQLSSLVTLFENTSVGGNITFNAVPGTVLLASSNPAALRLLLADLNHSGQPALIGAVTPTDTFAILPNTTRRESICNLGSLAPGVTATVTLALGAPNMASAYLTRATASAQPDLNSSNNQATTLITVVANHLPSSPPVVTCPGNLTACRGTTLLVPAQVSDTDGDSLSYVWKVNGSTVLTGTTPAGITTVQNLSLSYLFPTPGTYTVTVTVSDRIFPPVTCTTTVTVYALPTVSVNSATICAGNSVTLTVTTGASSPTYMWSPGGATTASIIVSPASTTTYTVTVTEGVAGCFGSASGTVTVQDTTLYTFTTLAGLAGTSGTNDGTGNAARFLNPSGVAVDSVGNVYVADQSNDTIRKGVSAPCPTNPCPPTTTSALNTGFDQTVSTVYPIGVADAFWWVTRDPTVPAATLPRPATVILRNPAWKLPQTNSQWISSYPTEQDNLNGEYDFETYFCLTANASNLLVSVCLRADDAAGVYVNGHQITLSPADTTFKAASPACGMAIDPTRFLLGGQNVLQVRVTNIYAVAMGLNLAGTFTGTSLSVQTSSCCRPASGISGQKFYDLNGNGVRDRGEPARPGWTINLSSGATAVTDVNGYYYFQNLAAGTCTVTEVPQSGWTQTAPAGGSYTVTLGASQQVNGRDFGNYHPNTNCVQIFCPSNIVTECTGSGAVVPFTVTATSLCTTNPPIVTCMPPSTTLFPVGTTTVYCTAVDRLGYWAICTNFTVTVVDATPPVIICATNNTVPCGPGCVALEQPIQTVLCNFGAQATNGTFPNGGLVKGTNGAVYGTTYSGGQRGFGTVFEMERNGAVYRELHSFGGTENDGLYPLASLVRGTDGALYGTTYEGGTNGLGTVFTVSQDGSGYRQIYSLGGGANTGQHPLAGLLEGNDGALYGTTYEGGANGFGTAFKLNKDGTACQQLHSFGGTPDDGQNPYAGLAQGSDGALYGTTLYGGTNGVGIIYKLSTGGTAYALLHTFGGSLNDGQNPEGGLAEGSDRGLYGTTYYGGTNYQGTVFKLGTNGTGYSVLHHFNSFSDDGWNPGASLVKGCAGAFYSTTEAGGTAGVGVVFKVNEDGSGYGLVHSFANTNGEGQVPESGLLVGSDGALYGTTLFGGSTSDGGMFSGNGAVFKLASPTAWSFDPPSASSACGSNTTAIIVLGTVTNGPAITRTWLVTDASGHTNSCSQTVLRPCDTSTLRPVLSARLYEGTNVTLVFRALPMSCSMRAI